MRRTGQTAGQTTASESKCRWPDLPPEVDPFRVLVENLEEYAIFLLDKEGLVRSWNAGAERINGYQAGEIIGRHFSVFYAPAEVARGWPRRELEAAARAGRVEDEGWRVRKDGLRFWASVVLTALRDHDGELYGYYKIVRDLTEDKRQQDALKRIQERSQVLWNQAIKDPLTGAFNRRYMHEHLRSALERADWVTASLLVIDIDHFKSINDRFGHVTGDTVLMSAAGIAHRHSRDSDMLFRLGGDEFVLYLPGVNGGGAHAIAERLRAAVESSKALKDGTVTVSIGVAELSREDTAETWLERADAALYAAKSAGRNRVV